jgi:hypothetical protein
METYKEAQPTDIEEIMGFTEIIRYVVDGWFSDRGIVKREFVDRCENRLMETYGIHLGSSMDSPTITKMLKIARKYKSEVEGV